MKSWPLLTANYRYLLKQIARRGGIPRPVLYGMGYCLHTLVANSRLLEVLPLDGALVRAWGPADIAGRERLAVGIRMFQFEDVRFAEVNLPNDDLLAVAADQAERLLARARRLFDETHEENEPPVLSAGHAAALWSNTIGYLEEARLNRINSLGGRARRGVLLTGSPGNGKTTACRWIWEECRRRGWEWTLVTPDRYASARQQDDVESLFSVERRGIIFFDDMDLALRDRETVRETDDQSVFLSAMDGMNVKRGVVFVFTTNCSLSLIDRAFRRPGRIDLVLEFHKPDAPLRRQLLLRWHEEIRGQLDLDRAVATTEGYSFAEIEELKNLLVLHFIETDRYDWDAALRQFRTNRQELSSAERRHVVGFDSAAAAGAEGKGAAAFNGGCLKAGID